MAYAFARASSQAFTTASAPLNALPCVLFARMMRTGASTSARGIMQLVASTGSINLILDFFSPGHYLAARNVGGSGTFAATAGSAQLDTWHAVGSENASSTSRKAIFDGSVSSDNTSNIGSQTSFTSFSIGIALGGNFDGGLAELALWTVSNLTADEWVSLSRGFKPPRIRPQSLVFYAPLVRNAQDLRGGITLTNNNGATVANHPRVY